MGHMEKQEMEMKWKVETKTGNGNWKRKSEQITHQSLVQCFLDGLQVVCFVIALVVYVVSSDWLYESCALLLLLYCAL